MSLVETLVDPDNLLTGFIAVVSFATIVTLAAPMMGKTNLDSRMKSVATRREELRRRSREAMAKAGATNSTSTLRHTDESLYRKVVDRLQLSKLLEDPAVVDKLAQAGFRGPKPVSRVQNGSNQEIREIFFGRGPEPVPGVIAGWDSWE